MTPIRDQAFQVGVVHRSIARFQVIVDFLQRLVRIPPWTESVRSIQKIRFENRFQNQQRGHLPPCRGSSESRAKAKSGLSFPFAFGMYTSRTARGR